MANKHYPSVTRMTGAEHRSVVKDIFRTVTGRYDFLNRFLSVRRDVAWRRFAVKRMRFFSTNRLLDVACGTGDLSLDVSRRFPQAELWGIDFVREMMTEARRKFSGRKHERPLRLVECDATLLPFAEGSFDVAAVAFGIRNIPERLAALKEMARVVAPGGQVMVLEMTMPSPAIFRSLYRLYLTRMLPFLARVFTANPAAYHYLADSIVNFPSPDKFAALMEEAGLKGVKKYPLTFGVTYLFSGIKNDG